MKLRLVQVIFLSLMIYFANACVVGIADLTSNNKTLADELKSSAVGHLYSIPTGDRYR